MNTPDNTPTLAVNGKERSVNDLPQDIQNLLAIYTKWNDELKDAKLEVFKLEAAIRGISAEIESRIQQVDSTPQV